ncbi:DUF4350 domain-containing protein [Pedobacter nutrimenti]|uniref:Trehalose utilization protein n=1 Tax=Pedobacter nutrimenti TaxID=1241337 RepID=A0A318ULR2_9SPHI|nr:DUF4350 domain-containing protein [Pedobacter nutrimenti]PYF77322.1 trehalose utilization protein [Pedobacter nutrimenti]
MTRTFNLYKALLLVFIFIVQVNAATSKPKFKVIAFYTAKRDLAHISYVREANNWFPKIAAQYHFSYDTTSNWSNLNAKFLKDYQVVLFLDTRPELPEQRAAFQQYMENGGAWIGFHFSAFSLAGSTYSDNWNWYHHQFLGSGSYVSNTWRPTPAILKLEKQNSPMTLHLPATFKSAANEWYRWENDLRNNPDIDILLSIDSSSFPLGTGPKAHEIWHNGYYPVVWTNKKYNMMYVNMGHNDIDYENKTNKELSFTFANETQNKLLIDALLQLGQSRKIKAPKVTLDEYFNHETRMMNNKPERFHYTWEDKKNTGFSIWGDIFKKQGARLDAMDSKPTAALLKGTSVYIIVDPDTKKENPSPNYIQPEDVLEIANWVKAGGVLVMMANDSANVELPHFNLLAQKFGMHFNNDLQLHVIDDNHFYDGAIEIKNHPIFKTTKKVFLKDVCSISTSANAVACLRASNGATIAATAKYGKGTVFAVGDPWLYNEYVNGRLPLEYENDKAAEDLAKWLLSRSN